MARLTPAEYQEKHARRLKASLEDIRRGVERISDNPMEAAAAKQDKMLAGIQRAVTSGKWARKLRAVTLDQWKSDMLVKGVERIPAGIDAASAKVTAFAAKLLPYQDTLRTKIDAMPDLTIEDSIARMTTWCREMAKFES